MSHKWLTPFYLLFIINIYLLFDISLFFLTSSWFWFNLRKQEFVLFTGTFPKILLVKYFEITFFKKLQIVKNAFMQQITKKSLWNNLTSRIVGNFLINGICSCLFKLKKIIISCEEVKKKY